MTQPITLMAHIELKYQGNIALFARSHGTSRQHVYNLINANAHWWNGQPWTPAKI